MTNDFEVIHSYSRAQALEDGVLIDITETTREAGIRFPVAVTNNVFASYVRIPAGVEAQDEKGRLWDIAFMLAIAIRRLGNGSSIINYELYVRNNNRRAELVRLKAVCGPGDDGKPVVTVMLHNED